MSILSDDVVLKAAQDVLNAIYDDPTFALQAIMVVVGTDETGEKWVSHFRSTDLRTWEAVGMIEDVRDALAAQEVVRQLRGAE